jgi:indole-3-glycerol phosphate synthase
VDILYKILQAKQARVEAAKQTKRLSDLREEAIAVRSSSPAHRLLEALEKNGHPNIIAEFKRRSPSKGVIAANLDAGLRARLYESGGAAAISVLTEADHFDGAIEDLYRVRGAVSLPILRKDFVFDEYQVYESAAIGADAMLLIVTVLDDGVLAHLRWLIEEELGMDALVEVHNAEEMRRALAVGAHLIGVNNRNLRTFEVSLGTSIELASEPHGNSILVSESGLNTPEDLQLLMTRGYRGFLIGELLMRTENPGELLRILTGR